MTVQEIYDKLSDKIPEELREPWDNDGLMCASDDSKEVKRALVTLDVTEDVVDYAVANNFDLILSHHPLIFRPLKSVTEDSHVARKVITLIKHDVAVISLHTRAGRIGTLDEELTTEDFSYLLKGLLSCDGVRISDALIPVQRVAVVGGDGKGFVEEALRLGADTYVSGRIGYNVMAEANEMGINLIEAGHFFTEQPVTSYFQSLLMRMDSEMYVEILDSNVIKLI